MTTLSNVADLKLLPDNFLTMLKSAPVADTAIDSDSAMVTFFQSRLPETNHSRHLIFSC